MSKTTMLATKPSPAAITKQINKLIVEGDTEYVSKTEQPTDPISVQLKSPDRDGKFYLHPNTSIPLKARQHDTFKTPCALFDYLGWTYIKDTFKRSLTVVDCTVADMSSMKPKNTLVIDYFMFWSFKDIELLFADRQFYKDNILPLLRRTRRISVDTQHKTLPLPFVVFYNNQWRRISLRIFDIAAMQGAKGLKDYSSNVGIKMDDKDTYTSDEKSRMADMYIQDPKKFETYAMGDLVVYETYTKTNEFYNYIATALGLETRPTWGMSTGSIIAKKLTQWLANSVDVDATAIAKMCNAASPQEINSFSKTTKDKRLIYTQMVDGGRAVKERDLSYLTGSLNDIDISGCYGNGLRNQKFAIGQPSIYTKRITLGEFLKTFKKELVPGLWYARVSYKDAPFKQDLLISKVEKAFTLWDLAVSNPDENDDRVYDASMVLLQNEVHQAALTHDLLQVLLTCSSLKERTWLMENMFIESLVYYRKSHKVDSVTPKMLEGIGFDNKNGGLFTYTNDWVCVDLANFMTILLAERKKANKENGGKKGSPKEEFLKLAINTTYGTIASEFFSSGDTGCSNVVVGNNITARARTLAWCMAKGFNSVMSVTDGGVFDVNYVLEFTPRTSLNGFEGIHKSIYRDDNDNYIAKQKPLFGSFTTIDELEPKLVKPDEDTPTEVDNMAWQHLKKQFPKLDIFTEDQFSFESKYCYDEMTIHSKVDYRLVRENGKKTIALRGMPKVFDPVTGKKVVNPVADELFDAINNGTPSYAVLDDTEMLSLADYENDISGCQTNGFLPHDTIKSVKRFLSHTPLGDRFKNMVEYKKFLKDYEVFKTQLNDLIRLS